MISRQHSYTSNSCLQLSPKCKIRISSCPQIIFPQVCLDSYTLNLPLKSYSLLFNFILCLFNNHLNYSNYFQVKKSIKAGERGQWLKVCSSAEALSSSTHVGRSQQQLQGAIPCFPGLGVITALTSNKPTQTYTYN